MTFTEFQELKEKHRVFKKYHVENIEYDRRFLKDRREFTYTGYTPERRSGKDRRQLQNLFDLQNVRSLHINGK